MIRLSTAVTTISCAFAFGCFVPIDSLGRSASSVITALSIVTAAVFVRLNRGMPTLDWKGISNESRKSLTKDILDVTREYTAIIAINLAFVIGAIALVATGPNWSCTLTNLEQKVASAVAGLLIGLSFSRMAYVIWRDYDIVRLQKTLIDAAGDKEAALAESAAAAEALSKMSSSNLRSQARIEPKP